MGILASLRKQFWPRRRSDKLVVLAMEPQGFALGAVRIKDGQPEMFEDLGFYSCSEGERNPLLSSLVARHDLTGLDCRVVLGAADYRTIQMAAPEVPEMEIRDALRWKIQDLIDFPAGEAEIEYFPMPSSRQAGVQRTIVVLVARNDSIRAVVASCEASGLNVEVVDVPELALRNLVSRLPESDRGVAVLYLESGRSKLQIQKGGLIYISRDLDFRLIESSPSPGFALPSGEVLDRLALEIQRSLDYYESYFGNPPVAGIVITPARGHVQALADSLIQSLGVLARVMDITALVPVHGRLDDGIQQHCIGLVGAALRGADDS